MADDVSGDEAAWQELVARFSTATADGGEPAPWPAREDLTGPPPPVPGDPVMGPLTRPAGPGLGTAPEPAGGAEPAAGPPDGAGAGGDPGGRPAAPDAGDRGAPPGTASGAARPGPGRVRARIVRPAEPGSPPPGDEDSDDHYVPPPPPPLPALDPVAKGAWAALFGGPAYLLVAVMVGWEVPGWVAFIAVAAFVGGFATLVVRMGDQPPRDSGPDNGAVV